MDILGEGTNVGLDWHIFILYMALSERFELNANAYVYQY